MQVVEQTHVAAVTTMHMRCEDHSDASVAADLKGFGEPRYHGPRSRRFHRGTGGHKIVLHIHHDHRRLVGINVMDVHGEASSRSLSNCFASRLAAARRKDPQMCLYLP